MTGRSETRGGTPADVSAYAEVREHMLERPDGRMVAWSECGPDDGVPMLHVPGTPGSRLSLRADRTPWAELRMRMITTERPGMGISTRLPGRGFVEHADDTAAILDHVGVDRLHVIGASGAGPHILAFAAGHPDRVRAVTVLMGAAPLLPKEADQMIGLNEESFRLAAAGDQEGLRALLTTVRTEMLPDPIAGFRETMKTAPASDQEIMSDPTWQESLVVGLRDALQQGVDGWVDEGLAIDRPWSDVDPAAVSASVTWWHATGDRNAPLSAARRLVAALPHAELRIWENEGHLASYHRMPEILGELLARG